MNKLSIWDNFRLLFNPKIVINTGVIDKDMVSLGMATPGKIISINSKKAMFCDGYKVEAGEKITFKSEHRKELSFEGYDHYEWVPIVPQ